MRTIKNSLLAINCLLVISCGKTQTEPAAAFPTDAEEVQISGDVSLINLSQDTKGNMLTFGDVTGFAGAEDISKQASQIQEKSLFICPAAKNPRLFLVGKIRVKRVVYRSDSLKRSY